MVGMSLIYALRGNYIDHIIIAVTIVTFILDRTFYERHNNEGIHNLFRKE